MCMSKINFDNTKVSCENSWKICVCVMIKTSFVTTVKINKKANIKIYAKDIKTLS